MNYVNNFIYLPAALLCAAAYLRLENRARL